MEREERVLQGRYRLAEQLGEGSDAIVYRAEDLRLGRAVAVKLLRPELRADPSFVARFEREARSAARLDHPHIVKVYDYGEAEGTYFLVMQYVPGGDLRARLQRGEPLLVPLALRLAAEAAEALAEAHAQAIVHRDVKPANLLLTEEDQIKVTDFGIAKMLDVPALTATAALLGTPHYLAPEQAQAGAITPATDVYSLGVVLYEMLAGRRPFEGESFVQVAMQHLHAEPPPLAELNPAVPPSVVALVERALAKDPSERFADAGALGAALREEERRLLAPDLAGTEVRSTTDTARATPAERTGGTREAQGVRSRAPVPPRPEGASPAAAGSAVLTAAATQLGALAGRLRAAVPSRPARLRQIDERTARTALMGLPVVLGVLAAVLASATLSGEREPPADVARLVPPTIAPADARGGPPPPLAQQLPTQAAPARPAPTPSAPTVAASVPTEPVAEASPTRGRTPVVAAGLAATRERPAAPVNTAAHEPATAEPTEPQVPTAAATMPSAPAAAAMAAPAPTTAPTLPPAPTASPAPAPPRADPATAVPPTTLPATTEPSPTLGSVPTLGASSAGVAASPPVVALPEPPPTPESVPIGSRAATGRAVQRGELQTAAAVQPTAPPTAAPTPAPTAPPPTSAPTQAPTSPPAATATPNPTSPPARRTGRPGGGTTRSQQVQPLEPPPPAMPMVPVPPGPPPPVGAPVPPPLPLPPGNGPYGPWRPTPVPAWTR
ncbi:MAG TPA: protein kinase [Chloroflexota bacterium]|nr:protein kinase [Chloroflexota bacterium]